MLLAYENGADVVITIDDDNFVMDQDFVGFHGAAGWVRELPTYRSTSGWFNVCSLLQADHGVEFYHRGYPRKMRWAEDSDSNESPSTSILITSFGLAYSNSRSLRKPCPLILNSHLPSRLL